MNNQLVAICKTTKILYTEDFVNSINIILKNYNNKGGIFFLIDRNIPKKYIDKINSIDSIKHLLFIEANENNKNFNYAYHILSKILLQKPNPSTIMIAVGGGITGDIGGFIASILFRGIKLIHIPTTLISQIDSSIGGKNAVNFENTKNQIGTIYFPDFTIIDSSFLQSLDYRNYISAFAEIIKYGVIQNNNIIQDIQNNLDQIKHKNTTFLEKIIIDSVKIKTNIVNQTKSHNDSIRHTLNFGHSFGHAIESYLIKNNISILHGEAVALGMILVFEFAEFIDYAKLTNEIVLIKKIFDDLALRFRLNDFTNNKHIINDIIHYMSLDKKNINNKITLILPKKIGEVELVNNIEQSTIAKFLQQNDLFNTYSY